MNHFIKLLFAFYFLINPFNSLQAQDCSCANSFEATVDAYEKNYSLFIYKVTDDNRKLYNAHTDLMREKAKQTTDLQECKKVLEQWLQFFRDGHTYIIMSAKTETYNESIKVSEKQFKADYQNSNYHHNPLLGVWKSGDYTVTIIPNPKSSDRKRDYVGVILESSNPNWKKDEVKFEMTSNFGPSYQVNFMLGDHSLRQVSGEQVNNALLKIEGLSDWHKLWPKVESTKTKSEIESKYNEFHITYVDEIPYLRFPDFYSVDRSYVDSLMRAHHENILKADFMVVDLRGNSGGSDRTYFPVLPYILRGPIELPAGGFWLSEYNIEKLMEYETGGKSVEEFTEEEKEKYESKMAMKGSAYFDYPEYSYTYNADTLYDGPKRVVLLTDEETASSGETFVIRAKQSEKVVVYGQNTAGVVDGFNGLSKDIGCFEVVFPSSYRAKDIGENPIDPYGIAPDVYLDKKVDALAYAIAHMKQLIKNEGDLQ